MPYLLDADVFIGAKILHYGFDFRRLHRQPGWCDVCVGVVCDLERRM